MYQKLNIAIVITFCIFLVACGAKGDRTGYEYAPQMYHSVPYEGLSQVTDESAGQLISNREDGKGEFFNSNPHNPNRMNMRQPPENTVSRNRYGLLPYNIHKDSLELAARLLKNPLPDDGVVLAEGLELYKRFCTHCHGDTGGGDGLVGQVYLGITPYNSVAIKDKAEGHIFHVITHGKGRMQSHASQLAPMERWKIVRYVQTLQKQ
ncbi:MAG: cytochrome c [Bacteroidetes bacterium]|nr:MAG: cytochrome c [Bacteroidota bacterium]